MEECEGLDSEMTELQELQCEASEDVSQDDEDEVEELHNRCLTIWSLRAEPAPLWLSFYLRAVLACLILL